MLISSRSTSSRPRPRSNHARPPGMLAPPLLRLHLGQKSSPLQAAPSRQHEVRQKRPQEDLPRSGPRRRRRPRCRQQQRSEVSALSTRVCLFLPLSSRINCGRRRCGVGASLTSTHIRLLRYVGERKVAELTACGSRWGSTTEQHGRH